MATTLLMASPSYARGSNDGIVSSKMDAASCNDSLAGIFTATMARIRDAITPSSPSVRAAELSLEQLQKVVDQRRQEHQADKQTLRHPAYSLVDVNGRINDQTELLRERFGADYKDEAQKTFKALRRGAKLKNLDPEVEPLLNHFSLLKLYELERMALNIHVEEASLEAARSGHQLTLALIDQASEQSALHESGIVVESDPEALAQRLADLRATSKTEQSSIIEKTEEIAELGGALRTAGQEVLAMRSASPGIEGSVDTFMDELRRRFTSGQRVLFTQVPE